jgi:drug/metabolite transporter (DMT)-like permease
MDEIMQHSLRSNPSRVLDQKAWLIAIMLLIDSLHFVFARLLLPYISPDISALYVQAAGAIFFGVYALAAGQLNWGVLRRHIWFFLAIGLLIGISTNMTYTAIAYIDPGTASLLAKVSIVFSLAFGYFWLHERFTTIQWIGAGIAILGSLIIAYQPGSDVLQFGAILILTASLMYALHTAVVKRYGSSIDFINFFFFRVFATAAVLLLVAAGRGVLVWPPANAWPIVVTTALVDIIISRVLYYIALRRLDMNVFTILLTLSPVVTIVWSLLLFSTLPGPQQFAGGAAVLAGVMVVTWPRKR